MNDAGLSNLYFGKKYTFSDYTKLQGHSLREWCYDLNYSYNGELLSNKLSKLGGRYFVPYDDYYMYSIRYPTSLTEGIFYGDDEDEPITECEGSGTLSGSRLKLNYPLSDKARNIIRSH